MKTRTIRKTVTLPASPRLVFMALADSKQRSALTGSKAKIPKRAGGRMSADGGYISGKLLGLWPGMELLQTWRTAEWPKAAPDSRLEIRLAPAGKGTRLTTIHDEVPASQVSRYTGGWKAFYWAPLRRYLKRRSAQQPAQAEIHPARGDHAREREDPRRPEGIDLRPRAPDAAEDAPGDVLRRLDGTVGSRPRAPRLDLVELRRA